MVYTYTDVFGNLIYCEIVNVLPGINNYSRVRVICSVRNGVSHPAPGWATQDVPTHALQPAA